MLAKGENTAELTGRFHDARFTFITRSSQPMKRLCLLLTACALLTACDKQDTSAPTAVPAPAAATAPTAEKALLQQPTPIVNAALPKECEDYIARAKTCAAKSTDSLARIYAANVEQSRKQWLAAGDKDRLISACNVANEQFAEVIATFHCE